MTDQQHHLVLIHGAWAGSWVWDSVRPLLEAAGYATHAVDLPGNRGEIPPDQVNLDLYCAFLKTQVLDPIAAATTTTKQPKISLVAHSGAGVIALQLAQDLGDQLQSIVIVAGMLLPSGLTFTDFRNQQADPPKEPLNLNFTADGLSSTVSRADALQCFFQDLDPSVATAAAHKLTAQPTGGLSIAATYRNLRIPILYVEALQDASVVLKLQRAMQKDFSAMDDQTNLTVVSMDTGHAPHVAKPHDFCQHVCEFLSSLDATPTTT